jgi:RNA polymerase sigma factor (TIGR02999 family)
VPTDEVTSPREVTELLLAWCNGDTEALHQLLPLIYDQLHQLAARYMRRESPGHTLQTTALVNEAYCKLVDQKNVRWQNRAHFFGIAAQLMRRILVDHARKRLSLKRGGAETRILLDEKAIVGDANAKEMILLDDALTHLASMDELKARIIEMRFFVGLTMDEIAEVEHVSKTTIEREWRKAKVWLYKEIKER